MIGIGGGGLRRCSRLVTAAQRPWGWVWEGGSGWLRECTKFKMAQDSLTCCNGATAIAITL